MNINDIRFFYFICYDRKLLKALYELGDFCFDAVPFDVLAVSLTGPLNGNFVVQLDVANE